MIDALPDPAPGFDQPIAVLKHCHDRIRKQLATLEKLLAHLPAHGADQEARAAAAAVLKYFDKAAHVHHEDEEHDLVPMLQAVARDEDADVLAALVPGILQDHAEMDAMWQDLQAQLGAIAAGGASALSDDAVRRFVQRYTAHMEREEANIAPMAKRLFNPAQMAQLGRAMQQRRGLLPAGEAVADLRQDYGKASLDESAVAADPFVQFAAWFDEALKAGVKEPNAMSLATVNTDGKPSARIVLVKQFDRRGFTWYTNYDSDKGQQLRASPHAALLFFWNEL
ncbi:MAG TPA: pyridoxamine 5'-phosphate oxidase family protein, partial [Telluria sp.]|nr:pyridoxamine 5'-phosphate oxidase family protein [Telluria sp.]